MQRGLATGLDFLTLQLGTLIFTNNIGHYNTGNPKAHLMFFKKHGRWASRCEKNANRDKSCRSGLEQEHVYTTCWKGPVKKVPPAGEYRAEV